MRAVEICLGHFKFSSAVIHLFQEVLDEVGVVVKLIANYVLQLGIREFSSFVDLLTKILGEREGRIVSWWQHQAVEQLLNSEDVILLQFGGGASDVCRHWADLDRGLL